LARLPDDGNRYEVLDGALLVTPQARFGHQNIAFRLAAALHAYCASLHLGTVVAPGAVPHGKSELQPDVLVVLGPIAVDADWTDLPIPALVVEVLSESTRRRDLGIKRDAYLAWGIAEYWAVDTDARAVHVFTPAMSAGAVVTDTVRWAPQAGLPPFDLSLATLFPNPPGPK
jgi:Uma2 family endonuclease